MSKATKNTKAARGVSKKSTSKATKNTKAAARGVSKKSTSKATKATKATARGVSKQQTRDAAEDIKAAARGVSKQQARDALSWFYKHIQTRLAKKIPPEAFSSQSDPFIGGMFFFLYDPKHKATLPWYDKFPLVIPIEMYNDGFLGLNIHYLPPALRSALMIKLIEFKRRSGTPRAYMKLSYRILKKLTKHPYYEFCIHRYLTSHLRSPLVKVDGEYWGLAAMLPVQQFEKASARKVWSQVR